MDVQRSISVVDSEEFTERGALTLQETLNYTSGVQTNTFGLDTRTDIYTIRGLTPLTFRDGLQSRFGFYNTTRQEVYSLERVEAIKGPSSVLFGRSSVGGIVNTTSKIAKEGQQNELKLEYGSFDRLQAGMDFNTSLNKDNTLFFRLVGMNRDSGTQVDHVKDDSWLLMPSITWQPTNDTSLSLLFLAQENRSAQTFSFLPYSATQIPGQSFDSSTFLGEPSIDKYNTEQQALTAIFKHQFNDTFSLSSTLRYTKSNGDYVGHTTLPETLLPTGVDGVYHRIVYASDTDAEIFSGNVILDGNFAHHGITHNTRFGMEFAESEIDQNLLPANPAVFNLPYVYGGTIDVFNPQYGAFVASIPELTENTVTKESLFGVFLHDQVKWENWIASVGTRFDSVSIDSTGEATEDHTEWSFDAGLMYQFENGISPYYSYAESFDPQGIDSITGDPLKPKSGSQHEIGVKYQPAEKDLMITASLFEITEQNRTISVGGATQQSGSVKTKGAEASAVYRIEDLSFILNYTYLNTENRDTSNGYELPGIPRHQASTWVTYAPQEGKLQNFRAGLGYRFTGNSDDGFNTVTTPSYGLVDAMVGYQWKDLDIQLNINNLFDRSYESSIQYDPRFGTQLVSPGLERAANLSVTYHF
ncbi:MAG: TonB-dependent siderophore receptor [Maribacter stanieri]